jgi:hypothetical protein
LFNLQEEVEMEKIGGGKKRNDIMVNLQKDLQSSQMWLLVTEIHLLRAPSWLHSL